MFFIPLNQLESVELVVHALKVAAGEADCKLCPAAKVCMKQCLTIADSIQTMINNGTLPAIDSEPDPPVAAPFHEQKKPSFSDSSNKQTSKSHLSIVK